MTFLLLSVPELSWDNALFKLSPISVCSDVVPRDSASIAEIALPKSGENGLSTVDVLPKDMTATLSPFCKVFTKSPAVCLTVLNGSGGSVFSFRMLPERSKAKATSMGLLHASTPSENGLGQVKTKSCDVFFGKGSTNVRETAMAF